MIKILLTHIIYEKAIEILFDKVNRNFSKMPKPTFNVGDYISIEFMHKYGYKEYIKSAKVQTIHNNYVVLFYKRNLDVDVTFSIEYMHIDNIIKWNYSNSDYF